MSRFRSIDISSIGILLIFEHLYKRHFLVEDIFLTSHNGCSRDYFTVDTIDHILSFHCTESVSYCLTTARTQDHINKASQVNQDSRSAWE
jgi:hypothetical protein